MTVNFQKVDIFFGNVYRIDGERGASVPKWFVMISMEMTEMMNTSSIFVFSHFWHNMCEIETIDLDTFQNKIFQ